MNILDQLNESQRKAVLYNDGAHLIVAGAGSGKTRVLTYKIAYLLQQKIVRPYEVLALTFTNKAAHEMKERIAKMAGNEARYINMGTFHSIFARILRAEAKVLGYNSNFTIYDQADSHSLIKSIIKELQLDDKVYKVSSVSNIISMSKNRLITANMYSADPVISVADQQRKMPAIRQIYKLYAERCRHANVMDFDDLLLNTYQLFKANEDIRLRYAERFKYVLVDEYQDTNFAQQSILLQLTKEHQHICAVGDDAQSIYSFRGAKIENILNFNKFYVDAKLFKLEQNYRSTQLIVNAANSLIKKNEYQIPKTVFSENDLGEPLCLKMAYSDKEEAIIVINDIKNIVRHEGAEWSDVAILYRTNSQSRSFEECMRKEGIPYRIYGGMSFFQRKEIKDVIAYFRMVANPADVEAFRRVINTPSRGIGDTTVGKILEAASVHGVSVWQIVSQPVLYQLAVNKGIVAKLNAFTEMVQGWIDRLTSDDVYRLGADIVTESGLAREIYSGKEPEDRSRQENLEEFLGGIQDFVETKKEEGNEREVYLNDYLHEVALLTDLDSKDEEQTEKVALMTIHSAKGLEFPYVFIVGLEENIFPSPLSCNSAFELEEERRLLYVAITRAEKRCTLTCAQNRFRYGRMEFDSPSRFIRDIDLKFIRVEQRTADYGESFGSTSRKKNDLFSGTDTYGNRRIGEMGSYGNRLIGGTGESGRASLRPLRAVTSPVIPQKSSINDSEQLSVGNTIEHQRFGIGIVIKLEGCGENRKATVEFRNSGIKQLLLKFAKFKLIE